MNECDNPIIIYSVPHFRDVWDNFRYYIRPDKTQEDRISGLFIYVTMPIAIETDHATLYYSSVISWCHRVWGPFGGRHSRNSTLQFPNELHS